MAAVNAATLEALWVSFLTIFQQTLERTKTRIDDIASAVPSSTRIEHYPIAAMTGRMREWVKDRVIQDLAAFEASVRNLTFEHMRQLVAEALRLAATLPRETLLRICPAPDRGQVHAEP
jgi:phage major head subunit gpT-like protein